MHTDYHRVGEVLNRKEKMNIPLGASKRVRRINFVAFKKKTCTKHADERQEYYSFSINARKTTKRDFL